MNLDDLQKLSVDSWNFQQSSYDQPIGETEDQQINFAVRHILEHLVKSSGRLATVVESAEHSGNFNPEHIMGDPWKIILAGLRLGEVLGISGAEIEEQLKTWAKKYGD